MSEEKTKAAAAPAVGGKDGEAAKAPAKKRLNKKYLVIGGILVADLAIMAGLGFFIVSKLKGEDPAVKAQEEEAEHEKKKKEMMTKIGKVLPKPLAFTVNIAGQGQGEGHYLKCAIQLEWEGEEKEGGGEGEGAAMGVGKEIEKRMPKITDIIINILSAQTYADLLKPSGKQKIKESIVTEINAILPAPEGKEKEHGGDGKLRNAFFTEFLVQ